MGLSPQAIGQLRQPRSWLGRIWDEYFADNPLVRQETKLIEGRSRWRSGWVWCVALGLLPSVLGVVIYVANLIAPASSAPVYPMAIGMGGMGLFAAAALGALVGLVVLILTMSFSAQAWCRDRKPHWAAHISTAMLTARQMVGGKTVVWMMPGILAACFTLAFQTFTTVLALLFEDTALAKDDLAAIGLDMSTAQGILCLVRVQIMSFFNSVATWTLPMALVAGSALRGRNAGLCVVFALLVFVGCLILAGLPGWMIMFYGMTQFNPGSFSIWGFVLQQALSTLILMLIAIILWRRLPRRVGRLWDIPESSTERIPLDTAVTSA